MSMREDLQKAVTVARALGDPTRLRLLREIAARGEISCVALVEAVGMAQATVSHHLKVLVQAGLASVRPEGPFHRYRPVPGALEAHAALLARALSPPARRPARRRPAAPAASRTTKGATP